MAYAHWIRLAVVALLWTVAEMRTDGFSEAGVRGELPQRPSAIHALLDQPFTYLASGRQAYVFLSADGTVVLKLFRRAYYTEPWYARFSDNERAKRQKRAAFFQQSYALAFEEFAEETGLLFVGRGIDLPKVHLIDKAHRHHIFDLNDIPFALQKRGTPFAEAFSQEAIAPFCRYVAERIARGVSDGDRDVVHNFGLIEGRLCHLDPGRLLRAPFSPQEEWQRSLAPLRKWLTRHHPEWLERWDRAVYDTEYVALGGA